MKKIILFLVLFAFMFFIIHSVYYRPPSFYIALMNFYLNKESLSQVHTFMAKNKGIHKIALIPGSNLVEAENTKLNIIKLDEKIQGKLGESLIDLRAMWVTKTEDGWIYFLGASEKFNESFYIGYIFIENKNIDLPSCDTDVSYEASGGCAYHIEDNWFLHYEWHPVQPEILIEQKEPWPPKEKT